MQRFINQLEGLPKNFILPTVKVTSVQGGSFTFEWTPEGLGTLWKDQIAPFVVNSRLYFNQKTPENIEIFDMVGLTTELRLTVRGGIGQAAFNNSSLAANRIRPGCLLKIEPAERFINQK